MQFQFQGTGRNVKNTETSILYVHYSEKMDYRIKKYVQCGTFSQFVYYFVHEINVLNRLSALIYAEKRKVKYIHTRFPNIR